MRREPSTILLIVSTVAALLVASRMAAKVRLRPCHRAVDARDDGMKPESRKASKRQRRPAFEKALVSAAYGQQETVDDGAGLSVIAPRL